MSGEKCQCGHIHSEHLFGICMATGYVNTCHCMSWRPTVARNAPCEPVVPPVSDEQPEPVYVGADWTSSDPRGVYTFTGEFDELGLGIWRWVK